MEDATSDSNEIGIEGTVIRATGSWYDVRTGSDTIRATIRGKFRLNAPDVTNPVVIGDRVLIKMNSDGTGVITEIRVRKNKLSRRAAGRKFSREQVIAANIDIAWIVQSTLYPKLNPGLIDRFLVMAGVFDIPAHIVINKIDLIDPAFEDAINFWEKLYIDIGYPVFRTSASAGTGIDRVRQAMSGKTSVVVGQSGVGKSSILNRIQSNIKIRTGEISESTGKGVHTTTFAALYSLENGGYVADTPGLREFGLVDIFPADLPGFFVEFQNFAESCHFPNCTHDHEPGCCVREAVTDNAITPERYESYLNILGSLRKGVRDVGR